MEKDQSPPPYNYEHSYQPQPQPQFEHQPQPQFQSQPQPQFQPQPQPQYQPQPQPQFQPQPYQYQQPTVISAPPVQTNVTQVTVNTQAQHGGTCPVCHAGKFESSFTLCGWLCCIFCFPVGIICCLCMRKKECSHCGFSVS